MTIRPIKPEEVPEQKHRQLPDTVFEAFNNMIVKHGSGRSARFTQNEVVNEILNLWTGSDLTRQEIFDNHWLDVESAYTDAGWEVHYDKPGYNETYSAFFVFSVPEKRFRL